MVQKKRKSKRQTPKTRHKIHRKLKQEIIKQKKIESKREKLKVKVPMDILRTNDEIQQLKDIRKNEIKRKQNHVSFEDKPKPVYEELIDLADVVIQLVDARDIQCLSEINAKPCINIITKIDLVPDFMQEAILINKRFIVWNKNPSEIVKAIKGLSNKDRINVSVVGQRNVGKSTFVCNFKAFLTNENSINILDRVGHIETTEITFSNVIRNSIDLSLVDVEYFVGEALKIIDSIELAIFYGIGDFSNTKEFLKMFGKKIGLERCKPSEIGKRFLFDVCSGRLCYYATEGRNVLSVLE